MRVLARMTLFWGLTAILYGIRLAGLLVTCWRHRWDRAWRARLFRLWARGNLRIFGITIAVRGVPPRGRFFLVTNHLSYVDIFVLSSLLDCTYVAKADVGGWPVIGALARTVGTVFIDRTRRRDLLRVNRLLDREWAWGGSLVVFAEGTSSAGEAVLPLKPGLLEFAARNRVPVHYAVLRYRTGPRDAAAEESVCWWGEMPFFTHFTGLMKLEKVEASVAFCAQAVDVEERKSGAVALRARMADLLRDLRSP